VRLIDIALLPWNQRPRRRRAQALEVYDLHQAPIRKSEALAREKA
jgi:hypothetical protein